MKVLFLDIDGVLQPCGKQERFSHLKEIPDLCAQLNRTIRTDFDYEEYGKSYAGMCDIGAVYYDWDKPSVERLRHILESTGAKIVLSTSWREGGMQRMKAFLAIYDLDRYMVDATYFILFSDRYGGNAERRKLADEKVEAWRPVIHMIHDRLRVLYPDDPGFWGNFVDFRTAEIREYLDRHPEITSYVAVDDHCLEKGLDGHFVKTSNSISEEDAQRCIELLNAEDGPFPLDDSFHTPELQQWRERFVYTEFPKVLPE